MFKVTIQKKRGTCPLSVPRVQAFALPQFVVTNNCRKPTHGIYCPMRKNTYIYHEDTPMVYIRKFAAGYRYTYREHLPLSRSLTNGRKLRS